MAFDDRGDLMLQWRIGLTISGVLLGVYGAGRLLTEIPTHSLLLLAAWMIGAVLIHDGIVSPVVVAVGWVLHRFVPARGRGYLQAALIMGGLVTIIAIPMIHLRNSQPAIKAILRQNFAGNLTLLLGIIGAGTLIAYAIRVARDQGRRAAEPADIGPEDTDGATRDNTSGV
jgi:hypothetical protein